MADVNAAAAPSGVKERRTADVRRGALELARATLAAQHGLTAGHSDEVGLLCEEIADELGIEGWERANLLAAAQLHDIGKVAVPDEILDKPGPLDEDEWAHVREHTPVGERIVRSVPELGEVARIVRHSHEHWDGSGYPDGLAGEEIPLASRVVLCVDAFHALRSDRPYRRGRSAADAMAELESHAGTQFDPAVVAALHSAAERVRRRDARPEGSSHALLRSRRVAALLIALVVGGSALAAIRSDMGFDRSHSADASTGVKSCPLGHCRLFEWPSLKALAARTARARAEAHEAHANTAKAPGAKHAPGAARDGLRFAARIEHRGFARRRAAYTPAPPAAVQAPAPTPPPKSPAKKRRKPTDDTTTHVPVPPAVPPGLVGKPPPPRGHAFGYYEHARD